MDSYPELIETAVQPDVAGEIKTACLDIIQNLGEYKANIGDALNDRGTFKSSDYIVRRILKSKAIFRAKEKLNSPIGFIASLCTIRHQPENSLENTVGWHFDANFVGWDAPLLIHWLALEPVGDKRPGLEFIEGINPQEAVRFESFWLSNFKSRKNTFTDFEIKEALGRSFNIISPKLNAGDCLIFPPSLIHRTQQLNPKSLERTSIEIRLFSTNNIPSIIKRKPSWDLVIERPNGDYVFGKSKSIIT